VRLPVPTEFIGCCSKSSCYEDMAPPKILLAAPRSCHGRNPAVMLGSDLNIGMVRSACMQAAYPEQQTRFAAECRARTVRSLHSFGSSYVAPVSVTPVTVC